MNRWKRQPSLLLWFLLALLALLPLLAYWQYRWLGQVSLAERERMQRNLSHAAMQFGQEFDQEITLAYVTLQDGPGPFTPAAAQTAGEFAERYRHWVESAAHPRLLRAIYQAESNAQGDYELWQFDPATRAFARDEWTTELQSVRQRLLQQGAAHERMQHLLRNFMVSAQPGSGAHEVQMLSELKQSIIPKPKQDSPKQTAEPFTKTTTSRTAFIQMSSPGPLDERLPGLVLPVGLPGPLSFGEAPPRGYRILVFDLAYIKQTIFPELARKHLFSNGAQDYIYSVVRAGTPELIHQSETLAEAQTGDVTAPFFKVRFDARDKLILHGFGKPETAVAATPPGYTVRIVTNETQASVKPPEAGKLEERVSGLLKSTEGGWQLVIRHRAGSLEAAVGAVRRRNLAISFGVLALLGVSVGLIVLSSRRAQALAEKQIEFVAGVSHELRTPLSVICSAAENLADGVVDNRDQIKRYGTLIRDEGRRLTGMVEQVLEFAGAQSGRQNYELRPVAPEHVIEDALAALHLPLEESGFEVEQQIASDLPLINADSAALSRALQNLLSNALKYGGESRWLQLSARVTKQTHGEELQLAVTDRGLGIAPAELPHIFEPFYRGKDVSAAQIHGNGLGLSLVNHIIEAHGGRVTVESKAGQGSTFTLHLPVLREAASTTAVMTSEYEQATFTR